MGANVFGVGVGREQGPGHILQVARWFNEASIATPHGAVTGAEMTRTWSHAAAVRQAAVRPPLPLCQFKNKFAYPREDVSDG